MANNLLRNAIRSGLRGYGVGLALTAVAFTASPVIAQETTGSQQQLETVTVTGSRIRKAEIETAQPIVVLDRTAIEHQGFNSVADILQNLTEAGTPPISRSDVLASGEAVGGYYIDLRNLGNNRTLILLNGKRLGTTTGGDQDLSQIPIAAIERVEVLKDGASSIYGSDAIAGVVNIITRSHYDGAEASAYVGQYDEDDGMKQTYSMTFGANSDRGSITLAAEYSKEDPVWAKDRWFSRYNSTDRHPTAGWSVATHHGAFFFGFAGLNCPGMEDSAVRSGGVGVACTLNPGANPYTTDADGNRIINPDAFHGTGAGNGLVDLSNANEQMHLQTALERKSLFVNADYAITDNVRFSTDILYNRRETLQVVAGYPFQPAFDYPGDTGGYGMAIGLGADSYFNPSGEHIYFYRRGWEMPRSTNSELSTYRIGGTLSGSFELGDHFWNWDIGGYSNQNDLVKVGRGDFNLISTAAALGPSFYNEDTGRVECGTADAPISYGTGAGACIPWNPFYGAGQVGEGSLTGNADLQAYLFPYYHDRGRTKTTSYAANITGSVFTLPAGDLAFAAGYEYRKEDGNFVPDAYNQYGLNSGLPAGSTGGTYKVDEYYLEIDIPLLRDLPGARELSVNVAGRYSDYSTFGDTTNGKFSLTWRPIDDLLVRANYAEGFRAPTIANLFRGVGGTFAFYTDPCDVRHEAGNNPEVASRCAAAGVPVDYRQLGQGGAECTTFPCQTGIEFLSGSSPTLLPETATSKTAGLVYSPGWVPGLDLSLDWYNIKIKGAISTDTPTSILRDCYVLGIDSRCSSALFTREAGTGVVNYLSYALKNSGWIEAEGWDLGVNYRLPEWSFGRFMVRWNTTYVSKLNSKADDDPATAVSPSNSWGGNFRVRSNASLDWTLGDFGATWTTRYYSSMKETCSWDNTPQGGPECNMPGYVENGVIFNANRVGANTFHDVQFRYTAPWRGTISVGANNVFGHWASPMYSTPNSQYSYYGGFDIGRFYYVRYNQTF